MPDGTVEPKWWISKGERPDGPFDVDMIRGRIKALELFPDNLACPVGGDEWRPIRDWKEAFEDAIAAAASLLPPPPPLNYSPDCVKTSSSPEEMAIRTSGEKKPISENLQGHPKASSEFPQKYCLWSKYPF